MRAADGWDSARFIGIFPTLSLYCSKQFSRQPPLTHTDSGHRNITTNIYTIMKPEESIMKHPFASLSIIFTVIFLIVVVALLFLAPNIDPMRSGISFYALTSYRFMIGMALSMIGIAGILLAVVLWTIILSVAGRIGLVLLIVWGITSIFAGIFPLD